MAQHTIATSHQPGLGHHVSQGKAWLQVSAGGESTAALSYAALELRFAIERLAVHYWATLLNRRPETDELKDIESFKRLERRIYDLARHQREIDGQFKFMRVVLQALKIDEPLQTPSMGSLSRHWSTCSELCHITWPLGCSVPELRSTAYAELGKVANDLETHVTSMGWPQLHDPSFIDLRDRFVRGEVGDDDVRDALTKSGIWARVEYPDGREPHFFGEAIPPESGTSTSPPASEA